MPTRYEANRVIFRHASDDQAHDCGRACAQMIISCLTQGAPSGQVPSPAQRAQPVPVLQDALRMQETYPIDVAGGWFTHPDELVQLLKGNATLQGNGHTDWRVASCASRDELLERIGLTLKRGRPAILNLRPSDHWVVVQSADYDSGLVSFLRMLDPLNKHTAPQPNAHTYLDGCATDGTTWWSTIDLPAGALATWDLPVGQYQPNNYAGRYVGIVYGPPPLKLDDWIGLRNRLKKFLKMPKGPTPLDRVVEELERVATVLALRELTDILRDAPVPVVRHVNDIDARVPGYTIASMFSDKLELGVVAIFDLTNQRLMHFRLTSDKGLVSSLAGDAAEPLWWTRRDLEALYSPYFPFKRMTTNGGLSYRRLVDSFELAPPPRAAAG